ncbi:MAG: hypothetical protein JXB30_11110 [Anaerolineae bacterium]|nr:hypothetical protein [Anaerolineae bacterium]
MSTKSSLYIVLLILLVACKTSDIESRSVKDLGERSGQIPSTAARVTPGQSAEFRPELTSTVAGSDAEAAPITLTRTPILERTSGTSSAASVPVDNTLSTEALVSNDVDDQPASSPDAAPQIISFTASPDRVSPGDTVKLSWQAVGSKAEMVECLHLDDHPCLPKEYLPVPLEGTRSVIIPEDARYNVQFVLVAKGNNENDRVDKVMLIPVTCPTTWFFEGAPDPETSCPEQEVVTSQAAWQTFEHGTMMWIASTERIHTFFDNSTSGIRTDQWAPSMPESDPSIVPPDGLYQPIRGFGLVWREFKDVLGWATAPEFAFEVVYQCSVYLP